MDARRWVLDRGSRSPGHALEEGTLTLVPSSLSVCFPPTVRRATQFHKVHTMVHFSSG